jgi:poly(A) polymerase
VFNARIGDVSGRGKLGADMREIWMMQPRFEKRAGHTPFSLVEQPRFRSGFDFMRLRADAGEVDVVLADWWQEFSQASDAVREDLLAQVREEQQKGQRRVRVVRPAAKPPAERLAEGGFASSPSEGDDRDADEGAPASDAPSGDAPRKRRRRRRKPGGGASGEAGGSSEGGAGGESGGDSGGDRAPQPGPTRLE